MIKRVYIDTSVFGGYFDNEFDMDTKPFFEKIFKRRIKILVSEILEVELLRGPDYVKEFYKSLPSDIIEHIQLFEYGNDS